MALQRIPGILTGLVKSHHAASTRGMLSVSKMENKTRPAPFPQDKYDWDDNNGMGLFDRTTLRFNENSKLVIVDGAHAVGKTALAKELAKEFDMLHMDFPSVEKTFINHYGVDIRDYSQYLDPSNVPYGEKDFFKNPTGPIEGCGDAYLYRLYLEKVRHYLYAFKHLLNTGQGVIIEGNIFSDYAHFEAAYNQGWIDRNTRKAYKEGMLAVKSNIPRPNVIIYLDAPVDVVMKKIKARGNEWDKDSPLWTNKQYLKDIYNEMKRNYLKEQQRHSYVLVYDWSEPGDVEVVVEDIENLELDYVEEYSDQQRDWKVMREDKSHWSARNIICNQRSRECIIAQACNTPSYLYANHLWKTAEEVINLETVFNWIKSERFAPTFNAHMGDKVLLRRSLFEQVEAANRFYEAKGIPRPYAWNDQPGI